MNKNITWTYPEKDELGQYPVDIAQNHNIDSKRNFFRSTETYVKYQKYNFFVKVVREYWLKSSIDRLCCMSFLRFTVECLH